MYLLYTDESGDCGEFDSKKSNQTGSPYFIVTGAMLRADKWKNALENLKSFRKKIAQQGYLPYDIEFHCSELIDPHKIKAYTNLNVKERWHLIESFAEIIGQQLDFRIISIVIDKTKSNLKPEQYLKASVSALYEAFDSALQEEKTHGLVFMDRANEKAIQTHVRQLMGTGVSTTDKPQIRVTQIMEDPIFRVSTESMFIQLADLLAFTLKEQEFPSTSRKKYFADRIFANKLGKRTLITPKSDAKGIHRI